MRSSRRPVLPLLLVSIVLLAAPAVRALVGSAFEAADGDLVGSGGVDWDGIAGVLEVGHDEPTGQTDDSLGGKEDDPEPTVEFGSIPNNKSDLLRFYVHHESVEDVDGVDRDFLYLGWVRANTLGSANMDFEFNQSEQLSANGRTPVRAAGDMLITFAFGGGGSAVDLGLSMWTETGPCEASTVLPCWGPLMPLAGVAEGAVNETDVVDPIAGATLEALTFGEAAIDLTSAGVFDRDECVSFGSAYVKSRSSTSFTSSMKDFIRPIDVSVTNCGTVTVRKNAVPDDAQDFTFTPSADLSLQDFVLDDDPGSALPSTQSFTGRFEGPQTLLEHAVPGWDLTDVSCNGPAEAERDGSGALTGQVTVEAEIGRTVDCTFTNTKRGRLIVDEITQPAGDPQLFGFSVAGGPDSSAVDFDLAGPDVPWDSGQVRPGTYSVGQHDDGPDWDLASVVCSDGSPASAVVVDPGETVTCTFTNVKRAVLIVDEATVPAGDAQLFSFLLTGGPDAVSQAFALADATAPHASGAVRAGTYSVAQQDDGPEWDLVGATCSDGSAANAVSLSPGEVVTCTFTNTRRGSIRVDVTTTPSGDPQTFAFTLSGGPDSLSQGFSLADATAPHSSGFVPAGSYAVAAGAVPAGWDLVSSSCSDGSAPGSIGLAAGESVTCTFAYVKRGTIQVDVTTTPSGDPQAFPFTLSGGPDSLSQSFSLTDAAVPHASGPVKPGSYAAVAAPTPAGWDLVSKSCSDGSFPAAIALAAGESVTCTFAYAKRGTIQVDVTTTPTGDPQTFPFTLSGGPDSVSQSFSLADATAPRSSGFVRAGSYAVVAGATPAGWDLVSSSCSDGSAPGSIALAAGESVTCTFAYAKRGTIRVDVTTTPSGDPQTFPFTLSGGPDAVSQSFSLADATALHSSGFVRAGSYAVVAGAVPAGWDLLSSSCSDGSAPGAIGLAAGESVTCTFAYKKRGTIQVDVTTTPSGDPQTFSFTLSGGPDAVSQSFALADQTAPHSSGFVRAGTYSVVAAPVPAGWDLASKSCSDGSAPGAIVLAGGESVTCTFAYVKRGTIRVDVTTAPSGDPQTFPFTLSGGPDAVSQSFSLADATPPHSSGLVRPGAYAVAAGATPPQWDLVSATCTDGSAPGAIGLAAGESVTCTFAYAKRARVTVTKIVTNVPPPGVTWDPTQILFDFTAGWGAQFTLHHGQSVTSAWIRSLQSYTISESAPAGWTTRSECVHANGSLATGGASVSVRPEPGEQVACTFWNELTMHPGSAGFWRNWSNHYSSAQFRAILAGSLAGSPIYATLFDPYTGALASDAIARIDAIFAQSGTTAHLMREVTSTFLNLGVSQIPALQPLQNNDDICLECVLDLDEIPGAATLLASLAPCDLPGVPRIADAIAVAEATWTGNVASGSYSFGSLSGSELGMLDSVFGGINQGNAVIADPTRYPAELTCISVEGPITYTWYRDADGDGHGVPSPRTQTCDATAPAGYAAISNDCDDAEGAVWPGAPEVCDGVNNDCTDSTWPAVDAYETVDLDDDGHPSCADCNDSMAAIHPGALEACNGIDDDCSGFADDGPGGLDPDLDGRASACDNCPLVSNAMQMDVDGDGSGDRCDNCGTVFNTDQADTDGDSRGDVCDLCPLVAENLAADVDHDGVSDDCDNCLAAPNVSQSDGDNDGEGDACDANDGEVYLRFVSSTMLVWDDEFGRSLWTCSRGDLRVLMVTGVTYQAPGSNDLAEIQGGIVDPWVDTEPIEPGRCAFYLVD